MNAFSQRLHGACQHGGLSGTNGHYPGPGGSTNVDRSGVQWLKLSTDTNGQFLSITNGRIYDPTNTNPFYYYCPSLAVNRIGDMVAGFSGSKLDEFITAFYLWRTHSGFQPSRPATLRVGELGFFGNSWGDYSATSLDPVDRLTFWMVQEYVTPDGVDNPWGTWMGEIIPDAPDP